MSNKNAREQLINTAIWQVVVIILVLIITWLYVVPRYDLLSTSIGVTNDAILKYKTTESSGLSYAELVNRYKSQWEILSIIESSPKETQDAIKKVGDTSYIAWLNSAIDKSTDDKNKLILIKSRLNSILPSLSPISQVNKADTVSIMRRYISYIENNILKQFDIESTAALGITSISYGKKWSTTPESIGSFDTEIAFTATNSNIARMISYINSLGSPEILSVTGTTSSGALPLIMSNPLAMIDSFSLQSSLDETRPTTENSGRMTIRFYIRGSSPTDISYLSASIATRRETLEKSIGLMIAKCKTENTCTKSIELEKISRKYSEFARANERNIAKTGTEAIYALSSELNTIISIENELNTLIK